MSYKVTCPACTSHTSSIAEAFSHDEPCPYCGLPAEAAIALTAAKARGADKDLLDRATVAEARAGKAEAEVARLTDVLRDVRDALDRSEDA